MLIEISDGIFLKGDVVFRCVLSTLGKRSTAHFYVLALISAALIGFMLLVGISRMFWLFMPPLRML